MAILAKKLVISPGTPSNPLDGQLIVDATTGQLGTYDTATSGVQPTTSSGSSGSSGSSSSSGTSGSSGAMGSSGSGGS